MVPSETKVSVVRTAWSPSSLSSEDPQYTPESGAAPPLPWGGSGELFQQFLVALLGSLPRPIAIAEEGEGTLQGAVDEQWRHLLKYRLGLLRGRHRADSTVIKPDGHGAITLEARNRLQKHATTGTV